MDLIKDLNKYIDKIFQNETFVNLLTLFVALYAGVIAPKLPDSIINLFNSSISKILLLFMIAYTSSKNIKLSLMISIIFIITNNLSNKRYLENFQSQLSANEIKNLAKKNNKLNTFNRDEEFNAGDLPEFNGNSKEELIEFIKNNKHKLKNKEVKESFQNQDDMDEFEDNDMEDSEEEIDDMEGEEEDMEDDDESFVGDDSSEEEEGFADHEHSDDDSDEEEEDSDSDSESSE